MQRKYIFITTVLLICIFAAIAGVWNRDPERRWSCFRNEEAVCANCRSQLGGGFSMYAMDHAGWFPRGENTPLDSLALLVPEYYSDRPGIFTSHALASQLNTHYAEQKRLPENLMCLRYNEGLREDDPANLILLYGHAPTRWECSLHKKRGIGRPVMTLTRSWEFLLEAEFQKMQTRTQKYLLEHNRLPTETGSHNKGLNRTR